MVNNMKTTIDISAELLVQAKKYAAENRCTLKQVIEDSLRHELQGKRKPRNERQGGIRWVTVPGEPPDDLDLTNREAMNDWLSRNP